MVGRLGTDLVSVACILGGAAAATGLTVLALRDSDAEEERVQVTCAVEAPSPNVVVALGEGRVHVQRGPRASATGECETTEVVGVHVRDVRREMERARAEMERARHQMDRERQRVRVIRLQQIDEVALEEMAAELAEQAAVLELQKLNLDELDVELEGELAKELQELELRLSEVRERRPGGGR